ncbi:MULTISPECIES: helix-turn-helix domain-containing protein [unclassified Gilliamella]|uniref:helix-turn-helix domain-containing protein n=1 Tax=unclassified Gilliamella TaxID=2685620 RepID=UPI001328A72C|nr:MULTISPECIES: helix-turn-helix transcriptional regulator [unclassified Gilliamella]MWN32282.1 helix-turn-helix domain-containing protein [Gilliamella sp. Pra-s60]MWP29560.1 helix-turn-helix domain-containing protein [Gilliamella sp. Pra-s54]
MNENIDIVATLCRRIKMARIEKNLSQQELAKKSEIGIATIKRIEHGESITLQTLISVLRGLDELDQLNNLLAYNEVIHNSSIEQPKRKRKQKTTKTEKVNVLTENDFLRSKVNTMCWKH